MNRLLVPVVKVSTVLAATRRSVGFVVCKTTLLLVELLPVAATNVSIGLTESTPLYSRMRMSE